MKNRAGWSTLAGVCLLILTAIVGLAGSHAIRAQSNEIAGDAPQSPVPPATPAGGVCNGDVVCEFNGFPNVALGQSTLTESAGQLVVSNIGSTGDDGVRIVNDLKPGGFLTAHNDWIDLGDTGLGNIDEAANSVGSYVQTETTAILDNFTSGIFRLRVEQTGVSEFMISHDFIVAGPSSITYEVFNGAIPVCSSAGQTVLSRVTVDNWPSRMAFSELRFPVTANFQLPGGPACAGTELRITPVFIPADPHPVPLFALQNDVTVKRNFVFENLNPFVIADQAFGVPAPPSGMGFSAALQLTGPAAFPEDGTNVLALPYSRQAGMVIASDLISDLGGAACAAAGPVISVARYLKRVAGLESYSGCSGKPFALNVGEAYLVKVNAKVPYRAVGLHRPALAITLTGPGTFPEDGTNVYAPPYHAVSTSAAALINDIGGADCSSSGPVISVARYTKASAGLQSYSGCSGSDFSLIHGEGYFVKVNSDVAYVPAHF